MSPDTTPPVTGSRQATAREFLTVVFRRRWVILGLFLATTATVSVIALSTPVRYASSGRVLVKRGEQESTLQPFRRVLNWSEDLASEVEVVKSAAVASKAQVLLDEQARGGGRRIRLASGALDVRVIGQSNVIEITYADLSPEVAHRACDAMMRAYLDHRQVSLNLSNPEEFFVREIAAVSGELERWTDLRHRFTEREGVVNLTEQGRSLINYRAMVQHRRTEVAADLADARAALDVMLELQRNPAVDLPAVGAGFLNEGALVELKRKIVEQEARLAQLRERYRDDAPEVSMALTTIETLRGLMRREVDARLQLSQTRVQGLASRLAVLDRDVERLEGELADMPDKERSLDEIDREIAVLRSRHNELIESRDRARITERTTRTVDVVVLTPATPAVPENTRDYVRLALAPLFSLVVGLGLAFFIDGLDTRLRTALEVEESVDLPVLATLTDRGRHG